MSDHMMPAVVLSWNVCCHCVSVRHGKPSQEYTVWQVEGRGQDVAQERMQYHPCEEMFYSCAAPAQYCKGLERTSQGLWTTAVIPFMVAVQLGHHIATSHCGADGHRMHRKLSSFIDQTLSSGVQMRTQSLV